MMELIDTKNMVNQNENQKKSTLNHRSYVNKASESSFQISNFVGGDKKN